MQDFNRDNRVEQLVKEFEQFKKSWLKKPDEDTLQQNQTKVKASWRGRWQQRNQQNDQLLDDIRCVYKLAGGMQQPLLKQDAAWLEMAQVEKEHSENLLMDAETLRSQLVQNKQSAQAKLKAEEPKSNKKLDNERKAVVESLKIAGQLKIKSAAVFAVCFRTILIDGRPECVLLILQRGDTSHYSLMAIIEEDLDSTSDSEKKWMELLKLPAFPQPTDGFFVSATAEHILFTNTLMSCVFHLPLQRFIKSGVPFETGGKANFGDKKPNKQELNAASASAAAMVSEGFQFRYDSTFEVKPHHYEKSCKISNFVFDLCLRERINNQSLIYVTNRTNIAVLEFPSLKIIDFLYEGLQLPCQLLIYRNLLIIAEKWGSIQIANLDLQQSKLTSIDSVGLECKRGFKCIEIIPDLQLILLGVYPEGNQHARRLQQQKQQIGITVASSNSDSNDNEGIAGIDNTWECHCYRFHYNHSNLEITMRYEKTLTIPRGPLDLIYNSSSDLLYIQCSHQAKDHSLLLTCSLDVKLNDLSDLLNIKDNVAYATSDEVPSAEKVANATAAAAAEMIAAAEAAAAAAAVAAAGEGQNLCQWKGLQLHLEDGKEDERVNRERAELILDDVGGVELHTFMKSALTFDAD